MVGPVFVDEGLNLRTLCLTFLRFFNDRNRLLSFFTWLDYDVAKGSSLRANLLSSDHYRLELLLFLSLFESKDSLQFSFLYFSRQFPVRHEQIFIAASNVVTHLYNPD